MIDSALTAGGPSWAAVEAGFRMLPPALATSVLNQTTVPSYWAPWISMRCGLPCLASCSASLIISAHVFGGVFTRSERYQSNWVLLLYGTATSCPCPVAGSSGPLSLPWIPCCLNVPVHGLIQPAWANSASQVTSRPRMSSEESWAASRRAICSRCWSAAVGSLLYEIVYLPWLCALQLFTASWTAPDGSGKL